MLPPGKSRCHKRHNCIGRREVRPKPSAELTGLRRSASDFIEGPRAVAVITVLIVINAIILGFETDAGVRATHGATPVETWTAYEGFADRPALKDIAERIRESNPTTAEG